MGASEFLDSEVHGGLALRTCRICLECSPVDLVSPSKISSSFLYSYSLREEQLVSPCGCTGTQAYVHLRCLRKWQIAAMSSRYSNSTCNPARICSVCTQRFTISPPRKAFSLRMVSLFDSYAREMAGIALLLCTFYLALSYKFNMHPYILQANDIIQGLAQKHVSVERTIEVEDRIYPGTILIASPSMPSASSMFSQSVVLLWDHNSMEGTQGVILNKILHSQDKEKLSVNAENLPHQLQEGVDSGWLNAGWGGPVSRPHWLLLQMCPKCANKTVNSQCECSCFTDVVDVCENQWAQIIVPGMLLCRHRTGNSPFIARPPCAASTLESAAISENNSSNKESEFELLTNLGNAAAVEDQNDNQGTKKPSNEQAPNETYDLSSVKFGQRGSAKKSDDGDPTSDFMLPASQYLLLGRAGWRAGQLAAEIKAGWWVIHPHGAKSILSHPLPLSWDAMFVA